MTVFPADRNLLTSVTKSLSADTMTKVSTGDLYSKSTASIAKLISLEFFATFAAWKL